MSVKVFFCYAHEDEELLNKLKIHLKPLERAGLIEMWFDGEIRAGSEWEKEIDKHLTEAQIVLLLVSPDFLGSEYCYRKEMTRAIERHERGEAKVIPVILRASSWNLTPIGKLQALPKDGKPVISSDWHNQDAALNDISVGIENVVKVLPSNTSSIFSKQSNKDNTVSSTRRYKKSSVPNIKISNQNRRSRKLYRSPGIHNEASSVDEKQTSQRRPLPGISDDETSYLDDNGLTNTDEMYIPMRDIPTRKLYGSRYAYNESDSIDEEQISQRRPLPTISDDGISYEDDSALFDDDVAYIDELDPPPVINRRNSDSSLYDDELDDIIVRPSSDSSRIPRRSSGQLNTMARSSSYGSTLDGVGRYSSADAGLARRVTYTSGPRRNKKNPPSSFIEFRWIFPGCFFSSIGISVGIFTHSWVWGLIVLATITSFLLLFVYRKVFKYLWNLCGIVLWRQSLPFPQSSKTELLQKPLVRRSPYISTHSPLSSESLHNPLIRRAAYMYEDDSMLRRPFRRDTRKLDASEE